MAGSKAVTCCVIRAATSSSCGCTAAVTRVSGVAGTDRAGVERTETRIGSRIEGRFLMSKLLARFNGGEAIPRSHTFETPECPPRTKRATQFLLPQFARSMRVSFSRQMLVLIRLAEYYLGARVRHAFFAGPPRQSSGRFRSHLPQPGWRNTSPTFSAHPFRQASHALPEAEAHAQSQYERGDKSFAMNKQASRQSGRS